MKLWTSGEVEADVGDSFRIARKAVDNKVNNILATVEIDAHFVKWAVVPIILAKPFFKEGDKKGCKR